MLMIMRREWEVGRLPWARRALVSPLAPNQPSTLNDDHRVQDHHHDVVDHDDDDDDDDWGDIIQPPTLIIIIVFT